MTDIIAYKISLATMAYAEVSRLDGGFTESSVSKTATACAVVADQREMAWRRRALDLALLESSGPEHLVFCHACRKRPGGARGHCDGIPVGYSLVGGQCWKAVRDGLV